MRHETWCIDVDGSTGDDGGVRAHGSGLDACTGAGFEVGGVTGWLQRLAGAPVSCVVDGHELDRGQVLKLIAQLAERAQAMPA